MFVHTTSVFRVRSSFIRFSCCWGGRLNFQREMLISSGSLALYLYWLTGLLRRSLHNSHYSLLYMITWKRLWVQMWQFCLPLYSLLLFLLLECHACVRCSTSSAQQITPCATISAEKSITNTNKLISGSLWKFICFWLARAYFSMQRLNSRVAPN